MGRREGVCGSERCCLSSMAESRKRGPREEPTGVVHNKLFKANGCRVSQTDGKSESEAPRASSSVPARVHTACRVAEQQGWDVKHRRPRFAKFVVPGEDVREVGKPFLMSEVLVKGGSCVC